MKINYFYYRSSNGTLNRPIWSYLSFYVIVSLAAMIASYFLYDVLKLIILVTIFRIALIVFSISLLLLFGFLFYKARQNGSLFKWFAMYDLEQRIIRALIDTKNKQRLKDVPYVKVPWVMCTVVDAYVKIEISKIAGIKKDEISDLEELINSSLIGSYKNFAVSSRLVSDDQLEFVFYAEDVASDLTWTPKTVVDLQQKPYFLKLQKGLTINFAERPNLGIWGATGSGKSTVVFACVAQLLGNSTQKDGANLVFLDGKSEYKPLSIFYPKQRFLTSADEIEAGLKKIVEVEIPKRQKILEQAVKRIRRIGLKGYDIGLAPLVIIADEIGNLAGTPKQRKAIGQYLTTILQRGRSISCFVIWATQDPAVSSSMSVLPQGAVSQLSTKILLGTSKPEVEREVFGESIDGGDVPRFRGYYTSNGLTSGPQRFFVPDLYKNNLSDLDTLEKLYTLGLGGNNKQVSKSSV